MNCPPAQVNLSQFMQMNQQVAQHAIGVFFANLLQSQQKSPIHAAAWNNMAQSNFANQTWNQWVQMAVDYTECLMRQSVNAMQPQQAAEHAARAVYQGYLGSLYCSNQMMFQGQLPPQAVQELMNVANNVQAITQQIQAMRAQTSQAPMNAAPGYYPHQNQPQYNALTVAATPIAGYVNNQWGGAGNKSGDISQSYDVPGADKPLIPTSDWQSDKTPGAAYALTPVTPAQQETAVMTTPVEDTTLPTPRDITEVKVDPFYYQPTGFKADPARPYDVIYNPGGVEIRPAHSPEVMKWKRTVGDDAIYSVSADPLQYCRFLVRFPDGVIKETFVKWIPMMDYLRHELDDDLKRRAYRPNGVVKAVTSDFADLTKDLAADLKALEDAKELELKKGQAAAPVVIQTVMDGESDTDNEISARQLVKVEMPNAEVIPAHEYRSVKRSRVDISDVTAGKISEVAKHTSLGMVAGDLKSLLTSGDLTMRVYRQLNDRLTVDTNAFLRDSLGVKQWMSSFCDDIVDMVDLVGRKYGSTIRDKFTGATHVLVTRALNLNSLKDDSDEIYWFLEDRYINFQLPWVLADITTQNITTEPVLLSTQSSEVLSAVVLGMWKRAGEKELLPLHRLRLITLDGQYVDIIRGHLVERAVLLKLSK